MIRKIAVRPCDGNCPICLDKLTSTKFVVQLPCKHQFHFKCYRHWEKRSFTCPICRHYNFFESYHLPTYENPRVLELRNGYGQYSRRYNRRYWPTLYNKVLSELRQYIRVCRDEQVPMKQLNVYLLRICQNRVERQDDAWYYDKNLYFRDGEIHNLLGLKYGRDFRKYAII